MAKPPGRGMVLAGSILLGLAVLGTIAMFALSLIVSTTVTNVGILIGLALVGAWSIVALILYVTGLLLVVMGRARQRGPVVAQTPALIIALGTPAVIVAMWIVIASVEPPDAVTLAAGIASLACLLLSPAAAAWAIWGRRQ